ncbi:tyrosine-type recombinase/integrase [Patescibacteria group bacterium]|nr:tyrosine-type recombinase/integrase [Patescibacteria group bacterium]MBU1663424.1 tyrosine-type recombinase/integrase [Patescibacteria group bacterium]MBU1933995.1 tyrosine-type recombinase/integrase [Patescibacteria group bacterium]MBU2007511.1 tyrosine-type recombinase/integrase [Patescibacteria group bacterium]MBU2233829.1 tyrosine-type recombinase/integrase [Patescibacteria group bacterium]
MLNSKSIIKYLNDFLDYLEIEKGLANKTQENYSRFLNKFFEWLKNNKLADLKPSKLSLSLISKYRIFLARHIDQQTKKTLKKSTQNYYLIALRSLLEFFIEKKIASLSPTQIKLAKDKSDKEIKFLNLEQMEKLLLAPNTEKIIGLRDRAILECLFSTGLRVAELISLNCEQIKIKKLIKSLEISVVGKGDKIRTVYFSERSVSWLKKYLEKRNDLDKALFINYKPGEDKKNNSRRLTTKSIEDIVKKYIKIAGLPVMATPHTIRHSYATDLLTQGVDLRMVQEFLGHKNIITTQIYTHVTNLQLKNIHKQFHGGNKLKN